MCNSLKLRLILMLRMYTYYPWLPRGRWYQNSTRRNEISLLLQGLRAIPYQHLLCAHHFHLHLARFIPGTSANAINFQAFLADGLARWNHAREAAAQEGTIRTFDLRLQQKVNELSRQLHGIPSTSTSIPAQYTGGVV